MKLSADEFLSLSTQLSDRDVKAAELELQLQETKEQLMIKEAENMALTQRLTELEQINTATELENAYLKHYLWLSLSKVKHFLAHIHDIRLVAFLQTFMLKTVSEEMGPKALEVINEAVQLPDDEDKPSTHIQADQVIMENHGTVNGPAPRETDTKTDKQDGTADGGLQRSGGIHHAGPGTMVCCQGRADTALRAAGEACRVREGTGKPRGGPSAHTLCLR